MHLNLLYIDPGTGSALFSIAIGIAAAAYFLFRAFVLKFKIFLFRTNKTQTKNKIVIYAEDKRYFLFFERIIEEFENRGIEILYLTQSEDDPVFEHDYKYIKGKYIGSGYKAFAYLNFLSADFVLTTTPDLDVLHWKRSKAVKHYCHLLHMPCGPASYRLFSLDYFDSVLLSDSNDINEVHYLEKIRNLPEKHIEIIGNPYFDNCVKKIETITKEENRPFTVLVSPSWGTSSLLSLYGEKLLDPLRDTGWRIIIRPHPQSLTREKHIIDTLSERYKDNSNIEWDFNRENIYSLSKSDIMLSDFSGIIFDYAFLFDRPVLYNLNNFDKGPYDAYYLENEPSFIQNIRKVGVSLDENDFGSIKDVITRVVENKKLFDARQEVKKQVWSYPGESGKRIADFITSAC
jgi:hypothetical protein